MIAHRFCSLHWFPVWQQVICRTVVHGTALEYFQELWLPVENDRGHLRQRSATSDVSSCRQHINQPDIRVSHFIGPTSDLSANCYVLQEPVTGYFSSSSKMHFSIWSVTNIIQCHYGFYVNCDTVYERSHLFTYLFKSMQRELCYIITSHQRHWLFNIENVPI